MARTTLTVQQITRAAPLVPTYTAVDAPNGNQFLNDGRCQLHVKNGGGGSLNVTITRNVTVDGGAVPALTFTVAAGAEKKIGNFPIEIFNQSDGMVYLDWSTGTSVTVSVERI